MERGIRRSSAVLGRLGPPVETTEGSLLRSLSTTTGCIFCLLGTQGQAVPMVCHRTNGVHDLSPSLVDDKESGSQSVGPFPSPGSGEPSGTGPQPSPFGLQWSFKGEEH